MKTEKFHLGDLVVCAVDYYGDVCRLNEVAKVIKVYNCSHCLQVLVSKGEKILDTTQDHWELLREGSLPIEI